MTQILGRGWLRVGFFAAVLSASAARALAQDANGLWTREDGAARIQFSPCGAALVRRDRLAEESRLPRPMSASRFFTT